VLKTIFLTGCAGFIGYHASKKFLDQGHRVIGVDNLNAYYDVSLKKARLDQLALHEGFSFFKQDVCDKEAMSKIVAENSPITHVVHLAAQAGVRYSLENPMAYVHANIIGHLTMLEVFKKLPIQHFVYASSSSVYGATQQVPFSENDSADKPMSLYAVTKRCQELMSYAYQHLYHFPCSGLRFFTVYGPWGRPDMAAFLFTKALFEGATLQVFNQGNMRRSFSYIDDIVQGIHRCLDRPGKENKIYNLGNDQSVLLSDFIHVLEKETGRKAIWGMQPLQPGDVPETVADISLAKSELGFDPQTSIHEGLKEFVRWYQTYYHIPLQDGAGRA
jgi:UDP-glucuronate 4-epimerase